MIEFSLAPLPDDSGIQVISVSGKLDTDTSEEFFAFIEEQIAAGNKRLILNCEKLEFISSMGLGSLMRTHSRLKKHMGDVKIAAMQDFVAETFRAVGFEKILALHSTVDDAQASFAE